MDVPKHVLDPPKNRGVVFVMLLFGFLPFTTTRCENDTIRHVYLSSFTVYRHVKTRRFLVCQDLYTYCILFFIK